MNITLGWLLHNNVQSGSVMGDGGSGCGGIGSGWLMLEVHRAGNKTMLFTT